jgi:hypothetical protein
MPGCSGCASGRRACPRTKPQQSGRLGGDYKWPGRGRRRAFESRQAVSGVLARESLLSSSKADMKLIISPQACGCVGLARDQAALAFRPLVSLTFGISAGLVFEIRFGLLVELKISTSTQSTSVLVLAISMEVAIRGLYWWWW